MPHHVFTRSQLYALVWAEPMRTVAARYGVSDVGLAKACRRADVPVPERGHWSKIQHGKATRQPALPARPDLPDQIVLAPPTPRPPPSPVAQAVLDAQEPPTVVVPPDLKRPYWLVREWIDQAAERRREHLRNGWSRANLPPAQPTALKERQRRLYSALLRGLEAARASRWPTGPRGRA
jgi:hypothetical protein